MTAKANFTINSELETSEFIIATGFSQDETIITNNLGVATITAGPLTSVIPLADFALMVTQLNIYALSVHKILNYPENPKQKYKSLKRKAANKMIFEYEILDVPNPFNWHIEWSKNTGMVTVLPRLVQSEMVWANVSHITRLLQVYLDEIAKF